ncbi:MAG: zinc ABC transporter substrate-binding protein [Alphaproteobacteria bacterium]|nr:zinc ABC transporter substrate-binding protein [Alphaproteobacteria bacterium]
MQTTKKLNLLISFILFYSFLNTAQSEIKVVTSIKPLHSLVSYVMDGVTSPGLIVDGNNSPHTFQLKPATAKMIQEADIIFWIGQDLETFLKKPLKTIGNKTKIISFLESKEIEKVKYRENNIFEDSEHDDHNGHDDHSEKEESNSKKKNEHVSHEEKDEHEEHHDHDHGNGIDPHIWTDPLNAKIMVELIAQHLSEVDSKNKSIYENNKKKILVELDSMVQEINNSINKNASFIVFHDAYQYFEKRFDVQVAGALMVNPEVLPGAKQLTSIREEIKTKKINCIFSEPQFNPGIPKAIAQDTNIKISVMDPLGADLDNGKDLYFKLIRNISNSIKNC